MRFWAGNRVLLESIPVNDDRTDNRFHEPVAVSPDREDEPPLYLLTETSQVLPLGQVIVLCT